MEELELQNVPAELAALAQWVLWRYEARDGKPTKQPFQVSGMLAKSNDSSTWNTYEAVRERYFQGGYDGIGFVFSESDGICGIDLDGCRDPSTGKLAEWARQIVLAVATYTEVSPSKTGVKLFVKATWNCAQHKRVVGDAVVVCEKVPAIEVYDRTRYFAVTGWRLQGVADLGSRQEQVDWIRDRFFPAAPPPSVDFRSATAVADRARKYLSKMPPAVSGQGGHDATFRAACVLVLGFGLSSGEALGLLSEWNQSCQPPWTEKELRHKVDDAAKQPGERNYLRNVSPERWSSVAVPSYAAATQKPQPKMTTLVQASADYLLRVKEGKGELVELGLGEVDYAIGGGVEFGEMIIIAGRPSHGKSAVALQCLHSWTYNGRPSLIVSEEMSAMALGKRALQYISEESQEHWKTSNKIVSEELRHYSEKHATCVVVESCGTAEAVVEQIHRAVEDHKIQCAVIDYAQLLRSPGKDRYEQITNTSIALRQAASKFKIVLVALAQLNREIEKRKKFAPQMSDLRETGQLEQDADVILFLVWPHRIDSKNHPDEYKFYVAKNRNRPINQPVVTCRFLPSRQMIVASRVQDHKNYERSFEAYNASGD